MPGPLLFDTLSLSVPIAVIGLGVRFPGDGSDPERFWQMLLEGRSARSEVPKSRYNVDAFHHQDGSRLGTVQPRHGHFIKQDVAEFDAPFFSITPKEAKAMDPAQRMLLEVAYEGLENAGITISQVKGSRTSCYMGTFTRDFEQLQLKDNQDPSTYHATGQSACLASNRVSWFYDLKGPSMTIDTACSSSLTAFHLACQSLRDGEAEMSIVGGSNLMFNPDMSILLGAAKVLSPDGKSQMWDHKANGYARGEGIGVVILKRLDQALWDNDTIRAVVLSSAANQDGRTPGISLPNSDAQYDLIKSAYQRAGVDPAETTYVEAHGTGTQAGDPLEAKAIIKAFTKGRKSDLYVGSVKTNIGHLEGAAGVAGIIKAVLMVERGLIPQNLWFEKLNPKIQLPPNVKVPLQLTEWPNKCPRRASINSFGFGGSNAHVVIEDAAHYLERYRLAGRCARVVPRRLHCAASANRLTNGHSNGYSNGAQPNGTSVSKAKLLVLSAYDQDGVNRCARSLSAYLNREGQQHGPSLLGDLAYTLGCRRTVMPWKSYAIVSDVDALPLSLGRLPAAVRSSETKIPRVAFIFTGQGAQWSSMGKELMAYDVYRQSMFDCESILRSLGCKWSLSEEMARPKSKCRLHLAEFSQPACTALQIALVDLLEHWGSQPVATIGHSSGEIAAAYAAKLITKEAAVKIAWLRGQLANVVAQRAPKGAMLAVSVDGEVLQPRLGELKQGKAVVACKNSPNACTISGDNAAIDELCNILRQDNVIFKKLEVEVAYHSPHMALVRKEYEAALSDFAPLVPSESSIPMFSSVTGQLVHPGQLSASYWVDNLVSSVDFVGAMRSLLRHSDPAQDVQDSAAYADIYLEVGPHSALRSYALDIIKAESKSSGLSYVNLLRRSYDGVETALSAIGDLWARGCKIDLGIINETDSRSSMLVDLPPYAWNHSLSFWEEPRLSKEYRLRQHPRLDLLGYRVPESPDPQWRNFLRCSENPWIRDHQVQGSIIYPGAGMIIMAIEGARQLADPTEQVHGYELRDISIVSAIQIPSDEKGVETVLRFNPHRPGTKAAPSQHMYDFAISSWSESMQSWEVHCRGSISLVYKSKITQSTQQELELTHERYRRTYNQIRERSQKPAHKSFYKNLKAIGLDYGSTFRNIVDLYQGDHESHGKLTVPDTKSVMPSQSEHPCLIHPATLDTVLHFLFPAISPLGEPLQEAIVPTSVNRVFVSADVPSTAGIILSGCCQSEQSSFNTWTSSISVSTEGWASPMIIMEGLVVSSVGGREAQSQETRALCSTLQWHEDIDYMSMTQVKNLLHSRIPPSGEDDSILDDLEYACLVYISRTLDWLHSEGRTHIPTEGFFSLFYQWMKEKLVSFPALSNDVAKVEATLNASRQRINKSKSGEVTLKMIDRIGRNLRKIFTKEVEPLQVMLEGDLLYTFYRHALGVSFNHNVAEYIGLIANKNPNLSILEIGAGTGGTTNFVLDRLRNEDGTSKAQKYYFTDISTGFLAKAAERFAQDAAIMDFGTLNIENDPVEQGFQPGTFDLIVCSNVLHATKSINETLEHCRMLLKPGGQMVLSEITIKRIYAGFIFGPLPGWWLGEHEGRKGGPLMTVEEWDTAFKKANFTGVDMEVRGDSDDSVEPISVLVSSKPSEPSSPAASEFVIVDTDDFATVDLSYSVRKAFVFQGHPPPSVIGWNRLTEESVRGKYCICLAEWEKPLLANISSEDWNKLRTIVLKASGTLWITGGAAMNCPLPMGSLMAGLSRAIRHEDANVSLATLDIEPPTSNDLALSLKSIVSVAIKHSRGQNQDNEFAIRKGTVYIPRVHRTPSVDTKLKRYESSAEPEMAPFQCDRALKLTIKTPGLLDTFRFIEDEVHSQALPETWVEIRTKAVGLNFKDVLVAMGQVSQQTLGFDVSGVVTRVGNAVTTIKPGDRIMTFSRNTFATYVRFPYQSAMPIPADMSWEQAAAMPLVYLTAYYALVTVGRVVKGESILIHAAAGGVGQAAIVLCQHLGAEVYATVGSEEKRALLMREYNIPSERIFNSRDLSFASGIMRVTGGKGVDVVLNSLAGEALRASWHCLASFGRFLDIGRADMLENTGLDMGQFLANRTYCGINLTDFENNPSPRAISLFQDVKELIKTKVMKPVSPIKQFNFSEIESAFRLMQTGKHAGKIILTPTSDDIVPIVPPKPQIRVQRDATYVLAGGLGGICRDLGRWLASQGAGNLIFLSRSAATGESNRAYLEDLRNTYKVNARAFNCNVADRNDLLSVLRKCEDLPRIRGALTGAMVLRDTLFDKMTVDDFHVAVGPKVHGTWNLHDLLPKDLEFFVMLSSLPGVMGHRGQGNYGAGNTFQDYFASYRRNQGLRAMTIDIGYLTSIGFVAEHEEHIEHIKSIGLQVMTPSQLHSLLATALEGTHAHPGQVMVGLPTATTNTVSTDSWYWLHDAKFTSLRNRGSSNTVVANTSISLKEELTKAKTEGGILAAISVVCDALVEKLAKLMMVPAADIDPNRPLSAYGVDSLVAVEVRNWMAKELQAEVSVFEIMANVPLKAMAVDIAGRSKILKPRGKE